MSAQGDTTTLQMPLDLQKPLDLPIEQDIKEEEPEKLSWLRRTIRGFTYIDTNYVEPREAH